MNDRPVNRWRARLGRGSGPTLVIAHRGDSAHAPENTIEAARLGHSAGADAWELDVRLARDGVAVVFHDESLRRTTDVAVRFAADPRAGMLRVADFDTPEIRSLDAGSWFLDPDGTGRTAAGFGTLEAIDSAARARYSSGNVRVPTLAEALELTAALDWLVNVELKATGDDGNALAESAIEAIEAAGVADRVLISSFDHDAVTYVARRWPGVATGVLTAEPIARAADYVRRVVGTDFYHPSAACLDDGGHGLDELRRAGVPVLVFTVNDSSPGGLADRLATAGVAGLFTDDPEALTVRWRGRREVAP
ncbi:MAG TPA: glycerophosphodiester phosphodiesterase family protein [Isosphaeraceae bacterium]|nr:glycerophosphodiester phosphodiesterase family protein [Isosphaeraceae bacterium]